ncbi:DgyrCDS6636 [Dimorphilus gyrociliatus]|uniref:DgyrCDS6636 n=1 Tax=Dimorphilus gyrociliatus TaxID=2664684 RepID=A0A7I8VNL6_9ANNE|nr:DgyrCDS6636 [Dimorphilus gyrociliatus]
MAEVDEELIRSFIANQGGKISNAELVVHFRNYLKDPRFKDQNRKNFKDIINKICVTKQDLSSRDKILVLRKQFRDDTPETPVHEESRKFYKPKRRPEKNPFKNDASRVSELDEKLPQEGEEESDLLSSVMASVEQSIKNASAAVIAEAEEPAGENLPEEPLNNNVFEEPSKNSNTSETTENNPLNIPSVVIDDAQSEEKLTESAESSTVDTSVETTPAPTPVAVQQESEDIPKLNIKLMGADVLKEQLNDTFSVKDRANQIDQLQIDLKAEQKKQMPAKVRDKNDENENKCDEDLTPNQRLWMLASCKCNIQKMTQLLRDRPELATFADVTNGTAIHWASKKGQKDVIKAIMSTGRKHNLDININARTGYTPLHLAAMQNREGVIELLTGGYGADISIRDYSGKIPNEYLPRKASANCQRLLIGGGRQLKVPSTTAFKRKGSYSEKTLGIASALGFRRSWAEGMDSTPRKSSITAGIENLFRRASPSPSPTLSRKATSASESNLMPPPLQIPNPRKRNKSDKRGGS